MKHLHTIAIDFHDISRLKAGESIELLDNTVLIYAGVKRPRSNGTIEPTYPAEVDRKAKKAAYNKRYRLERMKREARERRAQP